MSRIQQTIADLSNRLGVPVRHVVSATQPSPSAGEVVLWEHPTTAALKLLGGAQLDVASILTPSTVATTATEFSDATPQAVSLSAGSAGTEGTASRSDHVHYLSGVALADHTHAAYTLRDEDETIGGGWTFTGLGLSSGAFTDWVPAPVWDGLLDVGTPTQRWADGNFSGTVNTDGLAVAGAATFADGLTTTGGSSSLQGTISFPDGFATTGFSSSGPVTVGDYLLLNEGVGTPVAPNAGSGVLYVDTVAGNAEAFYLGPDGVPVQLTSNGTVNVTGSSDADTLDGLDSTAFALAGHTHTGLAQTASATLDFGAEQTLASATVAAAWVGASTRLAAQILGEDAAVQDIKVVVDNILNGVSFDILGFAPEGASGTFTVHVIGV